MITPRRHFHTFDALRFFSFLLVFLTHIPIPANSVFTFFSKSGGIGVSFFFVLSGFLITYILLYEKKMKNKISLKNFFLRRILRIWPLFYAMILFSFLTPYILDLFGFTYSDDGYEPQWLISLFFLENYKMMITGSHPNVSPLMIMWSLCVEEHFYILWGIILYFISIKRVPFLIIFSLVLANITRIFYFHYNINTLDILSNIDFFAYGAIPAYFLINKDNIIKQIGNIPLSIKYSFLFTTLCLIFILPNMEGTLLHLLLPTIFGISFSCIIFFTLPEENSIYISDSNVLSRLGKYTYGLYLFHIIIINLLIQIIPVLPFDMKWIVVGIISLFLTILISIISYNVFEKQFLKLKKYFV